MASSHFILNFDRISGDASVMGFGRNSSVKPEAGLVLNLVGIFECNRLQEFVSE